MKGADKVPIMLANQVNKTVKISKEEEVGKVLPIRFIKHIRYNEQRKRGQNQVGQVREEVVIAPEEFKARIGHLLRVNSDLVTNSDQELGLICSEDVPIKLKPYRTPIHKRPLVDEEVRDMLESRIIDWSESP